MSTTKLNKFKGAVRTINSFKTEKEVADFLLTNGHKGRPGRAECCPVANYIASECKMTPNVTGRRAGASLVENKDDMETQVVAGAALSDPAAKFISEFDAGKFPDLVLG